MRFPARRVTGGKVTGRVARSTIPISFLGELDANTGKVDNRDSELNQRVVSGMILAFPEGRGSTVGPYVLYGAKKRGVAPIAMVVGKADAIVASAAVLAKVPCVTGVDVNILADGEEITVDADEGFIEVPKVEEEQMVTSFLMSTDAKVLLTGVTKGSEQPGTLWGGFAAAFRSEVSGLEQARSLISKGTGLGQDEISLVRAGDTIHLRLKDKVYTYHPFLFRARTADLRPKVTESGIKWLGPGDVRGQDALPGLETVLSRLTGK